ncbi:MAG: hypothetical protein HY675_12620 [Chloroflexi bacterium]|nr:hypothetical protein [Chloroflexota bacterium]
MTRRTAYGWMILLGWGALAAWMGFDDFHILHQEIFVGIMLTSALAMVILFTIVWTRGEPTEEGPNERG